MKIKPKSAGVGATGPASVAVDPPLRRVAHARGIRRIRVPYAPQLEFDQALDELRTFTVDNRGEPQPGVQLIARSYSGKTNVLKASAARINGLQPDGRISIAVAVLEPEGSLASVAQDILTGLGEPRPERGDADLRWQRVRWALEERQIDTLAFDEFGRAGRSRTVRGIIAAKIQCLMDKGLCSVAFVGTEDSNKVFAACPDLANRLDAPVTMDPLRWYDDEEQAIFVDLVRDYEREMVAQGFVDGPCGFDADKVAEPLIESCKGLVGCFSRIVETALMSVYRDGRRTIEVDDLVEAVDQWAVKKGVLDHNPFRTARP